jgi:hypothetical protein
MPLIKGKEATTKKGFSANVRAEKKSGKPLDQSLAISYSLKLKAQSQGKKSEKR